jgi:hypothetical protein
MGIIRKIVEKVDKAADKRIADVVDKAVPPAPKKPKGGK